MIDMYLKTDTYFDYDRSRWSTHVYYSFDEVNYKTICVVLHDTKDPDENILAHIERRKEEFIKNHKP